MSCLTSTLRIEQGNQWESVTGNVVFHCSVVPLAQCFQKTWSWTGIPVLRGQRGSFNSSNPLEEEWECCWPAAAYWTTGPTLWSTHTAGPQHTRGDRTLCVWVRGLDRYTGPILGFYQTVDTFKR